MASARSRSSAVAANQRSAKWCNWPRKRGPTCPKAALQRVAAEILAAQTDFHGDKRFGRRSSRRSQRELRIDPMVKKAMAEAFAVVLEEFRDVTLKDSAVLESVGRQVHGVTGGQMQEFAQRLRDAVPRPLTEEQILGWADSYKERTSNWPTRTSGDIPEAPGDKWSAIDAALSAGLRGLPEGSSLAKLLHERRGVRNIQNLPDLTEDQILIWADAHMERAGEWPNQNSGSIDGAPGETWAAVNASLTMGLRGLTGGTSLAKLLHKRRGVRNIGDLPPLAEEQILKWADVYNERTGKWPKQNSGPVADAPGESWPAINTALQQGLRGMPGGSSLVKLLEKKRGVRNKGNLPSLTEEQIMEWADAHRGARENGRRRILVSLLKHRAKNGQPLAPLSLQAFVVFLEGHHLPSSLRRNGGQETN